MLVLCYSELIVSQNSMERREKKIMSIKNVFLACCLKSVILHLQPHDDSHIYTLVCIIIIIIIIQSWIICDEPGLIQK